MSNLQVNMLISNVWQFVVRSPLIRDFTGKFPIAVSFRKPQASMKYVGKRELGIKSDGIIRTFEISDKLENCLRQRLRIECYSKTHQYEKWRNTATHSIDLRTTFFPDLHAARKSLSVPFCECSGQSTYFKREPSYANSRNWCPTPCYLSPEFPIRFRALQDCLFKTLSLQL